MLPKINLRNLAKSAAAGEAAAFARLLRDSKIDCEALLKQMR
jgi:hypothetical protein